MASLHRRLRTRRHAKSTARRRVRSRLMADRLYFTDDPEACALIAGDPFALLVGFAIDQQVPVQKAFAGPLVLEGARGHARSEASSPRSTSSRPSARSRRFTASRARWRAGCASSPPSSPTSTEAMPHGSGRGEGRGRPSPPARRPSGLRPDEGHRPRRRAREAVRRRQAEPLVPGHMTLGDVDSPAVARGLPGGEAGAQGCAARGRPVGRGSGPGRRRRQVVDCHAADRGRREGLLDPRRRSR